MKKTLLTITIFALLTTALPLPLPIVTTASATSSAQTGDVAPSSGGFKTYSDTSCTTFVANVNDVPSLTNLIGLGVVHSYQQIGLLGGLGPCISVPSP